MRWSPFYATHTLDGGNPSANNRLSEASEYAVKQFQGGAVSKQTFDALHDAVAAHIADESEGDYLTEWVLSAAAVVADTPRATSYHYYDSELPVHHAIGLLHKATDHVAEYDEVDDDDD